MDEVGEWGYDDVDCSEHEAGAVGCQMLVDVAAVLTTLKQVALF